MRRPFCHGCSIWPWSGRVLSCLIILRRKERWRSGLRCCNWNPRRAADGAVGAAVTCGLSALARRQHRNNGVHRGARLGAQHVVVIVGDGMADDRERIILQTVYLTDRLRSAREVVGNDRHGGDAESFGFDGVVQTAR